MSGPQVYRWGFSYARAGAVGAGSLGLLVLAGWALDVGALKSILPGLVTMKPNTALGLTLGGAGLWLLAGDQTPRAARWVGRTAAALILLVGVLTLSEYGFGWDLGFDQWLFREPAAALFTTHAGRMSPLTALTFAALGAALLMLESRRAVPAAQVLALFSGLVSLLVAFGYMFGLRAFPFAGAATPMAPHTALGILVLAAGLVAATAGRGLLARVAGRSRVAAAGLAVVLVALAGAAAFWSTRRVAETASWVTHTYRVLRLMQSVRANLQEAGAAQRAFVATGVEAFLAPAAAARDALSRDLASLRHGISYDPEQLRRLAALELLVGRRLAHSAESERLRRARGAAVAIAYVAAGEGERLAVEIRVLMREMELAEEELLARRRADAAESVASGQLAFGVAAVAGLAILVGLFVALNRLNRGLESRVAERTALHAASERKYRDLADSALVGIYRSTVRGELLYVNAAMVRMMGFDSAGAMMSGGAAARWRDPHDRQVFLEALQHNGKAESFECVLLRANGQPMHALISAAIDGEELTGTVLDITDRKRAEEELQKHREHLEELVEQRTRAVRESEDKFRNVFENSPIGKSLTTPEGRVQVNKAFADMLGYSVEELAALHWKQVTHPDDIDESRRVVASLLAGEARAARFQKRYVHRNGGTVWADVSTFLQRDANDRPQFFITSISDITERKRADEALRHSNAQLEAANQELEAFSYSVSHDLRAPLRHIQGFANLLREATGGQLSNEARRCLDTIRDASVEMGQLIDDLLTFARVGRTAMQQSRVQLGELVQDAIRGLETAVAGRNITWRTAPLPAVVGDPSLLKQVLANLIGNAVKYSRMRDPAHVEIGCAGEEDGRIILFVRDDGAGFDMRYAHKLFGVFQRLHRADEFEGTGVGLATVRRIVARHGGRVWAEGAVNEGATFYLTLLPAQPA